MSFPAPRVLPPAASCPSLGQPRLLSVAVIIIATRLPRARAPMAVVALILHALGQARVPLGQQVPGGPHPRLHQLLALQWGRAG